MAIYKLKSKFKPSGDQPTAIKKPIEGVKVRNEAHRFAISASRRRRKKNFHI